MEKHTTVSLLSAVMAVLAAFDANAGVSLFSDYGQIQNVQKYSSNPFWTPNSPYNQRLPQPVYAQGADLNAGDCIKVVQSKVAVQCMARDNCRNTKLADIRPTIMIELSNLPGNNYVSACSGYIDSVFESYVQQYGSSLPNRGIAFPTATEPNQNLNDNGIQIKNPYQQTTPKWKSEYMERSNELAALQRENGAGTEHLEHNDFPATFNDLSFAARSQFANDDYAIYKDLDTYKGLNALDDEEWCNEHPTSKECLTYTETTTNCTDLFANVPHVVRAEWDNPKSAKRVCQVVQCEAGFRPHPKTKDKCIENEDTDCTNEIPHATRAEIDKDGKCVVSACEPLYKISDDETACEPLSQDEDCTQYMQRFVPETSTAQIINGICKITSCSGDLVPNIDGTQCIPCQYGYDKKGNKCERNICPLTPHILSESTQMFAICDVHTQDIGKKIVQELIKCSDTPTAVIGPVSISDNQDYILVKSADETVTIGNFEFDDLGDGYLDQYRAETFYALAQIAGAPSCFIYSNHTGVICGADSIEPDQFKAFQKQATDLIGSGGYQIMFETVDVIRPMLPASNNTAAYATIRKITGNAHKLLWFQNR